jgi:hypothetical protein
MTRQANKGAAANRRPAGQSDGSGNLFATVAADRAFPAAVPELIVSRHPAHMHVRTFINFASLVVGLLSASVLPAADTATVPELRGGDVLLCQPYPYRTVTNTSRTVYQIARLSFTSVRSFQQKHDLKADGIIGPLTQRRVDAEYQRRFGQAATTNRTTLSVSVQPVATTTGITATVTVRGVATPVRIVGSLTFDESRGFRFADPTASLHTKTCLRRGDLVSFGGRRASVALIQQQALMTGSTELPALATGESGRLFASIIYLSADLTERVADADAPLQ